MFHSTRRSLDRLRLWQNGWSGGLLVAVGGVVIVLGIGVTLRYMTDRSALLVLVPATLAGIYMIVAGVSLRSNPRR